MKFNIILEEAEEGGYNVKIPALDGCFTQGNTLEDAINNSKEAIVCYLEGLQKLFQIN
ncbi:type II toxin-antitoxin system HicB family antitoxin [candidate division KSB1 bacterium]|nr:type II toxin-antitoxin system HicB family antitoxin [candidate division KSB1 bacterium]